jgi:hypothetical protein
MVCSCGEQFIIQTDGNDTCTMCGVIGRSNFVNRFDAPRDSLCQATYERHKRFRDIVTKVVFPCVENKDYPMYEYLKSTNKQFETVGDVLQAMKRSKLLNKRYCSLHTFCRFFLKNYVKPKVESPLLLIKMSVRMFTFLESEHYKKCTGNFFNYGWLLRRLLDLLDCDTLKRYVKPIKCPKRNEFYENMFCSLNCKFDSCYVVV